MDNSTTTLIVIIFMIIIAVSLFLVRDSYKRRRRYENKDFYIAPLEQRYQRPFNTQIYQESVNSSNQMNITGDQNRVTDVYGPSEIEFNKNITNNSNPNLQKTDGNNINQDYPPINFCPKCGNKLHEGVYYCSACGYKVR